MSSPNLTAGAFITTVNNRRCTAIPKSLSAAASATTTSTSASSSSTSSSTLSSTSTSKSSKTTKSKTTSAPAQSTSTEPTTSAAPAPVASSSSAESTSTSTPQPQTTPQVSTASSTSTSATSTTVSPASTSTAASTTSTAAVVPTTTSYSSSTTSPSTTSSETGNGLAIISSSTPTSTLSVSTTFQSSDSPISASSLSTTVKPDADTSSTSATIFSSTAKSTTSVTPAEQVTTIGIADSITSAAATSSTVSNITQNSSSNDNAPVGAIVGSVLGGLFFVIIIALLLWWWRKRQLKKRRSTLLTPLTLDPNGGPPGSATKPTKERAYIIDRDSLGPTPRTARFKATLAYNVSRLRNQFSAESAEADRHSQMMTRATPPMSQKQAMFAGAVAMKDKAGKWMMGVIGKRPEEPAPSNSMPSSRSGSPNGDAQPSMGSKPEFMNYLGMDANDVRRSTQIRQANHSASNSASSTDQLLPNSSRGGDPFSDDNAVSVPIVLGANGAGKNPFSDQNEISKQSKSTYAAALRQTRGESMARAPKTPKTPKSPFGGNGKMNSVYRSSYRSKFRSDQFDLDRDLGRISPPAPPMPPFMMLRPDSAISVNSNSTTASGVRSPKRPLVARLRGDSLSSKWSSGVSLGDWSDPGPDVGPDGLPTSPVPPVPTNFLKA